MLFFFKLQLLVFFLFTNLFCIQHSDLNVLVTRAPGKDIYLKESGSMFLKQASDNREKSKYGSYFRIIPFYQKMQSPRKVSSYFGLKGKAGGINYKQGRLVGADLDSTTLLHDSIPDQYLFKFDLISRQKWFVYHKPENQDDLGHVYVVDQDASGQAKKNADGSYELFIHSNNTKVEGPLSNNSNNVKIALQDFEQNNLPKRALSGSLGLKAEREVFGLLFAYYFFFKTGFWVEAAVPVLYFKQGLFLNIEFENKSINGQLNKRISMNDLLTGSFENMKTFSNSDNENLQKKLLYSKFMTKKVKEASVGDPEILAGYRIFDSEKSDCDIYFKASIPIAKSIDPEYLFPPQAGNNGHFMLGAGLKCSAEIFKFQEIIVNSEFNFNLNYSFANTQRRVLGSYSDRGVIIPWDRYCLVAKVNSAGPMEPFANVSMTNVIVSPDFSGESYVSLIFSYKSFMFSFGHSAFFRSSENVISENWPNAGKYGRPSTSAYRTDQRYVPANFQFGEMDATEITMSEIETETCSTPGSLPNLIFAKIGYQYQECEDRLFYSGLGISFEFINANSALNNLTLFGTFGFTF